MRVKLALIICLINYGDASLKINPNIVLILADDMGWNDVSYHGSNQIPTPNIDALAYNGLILERFYVAPLCTPSRAALLTGQYPIRYGFQGLPIRSGEDRHLPLELETLPLKLKQLGYGTALIGKWHLGFSHRNATPTYRGFDYHVGYWTGLINYFDHVNSEEYAGFDMHEDLYTAWHLQHEYATHLFTRKAQEVIRKHDYERPLFLMMSHLAAHAGNQKLLEVPDIDDNNRRFHYIEDGARRLYAGIVTELDTSVGVVIQALRDKGVLNNTIIVFLSDNGAQNIGEYDNSGSNWPLRGMKATVFEGAVRSPAFFYYSKLQKKSSVNSQLMHITDLMPTLYAAAGGNVETLGTIDGINQWDTITRGARSTRSSALLDIDEVAEYSSLIGYNGHYKLINGSVLGDFATDGYFGGDAGRSANPPYDVDSILSSLTNRAIDGGLTREKVVELRGKLTTKCAGVDSRAVPCDPDRFCLFDVMNDPCETANLAKKYPHMVHKLSEELSKYWRILQPQSQHLRDKNADPSRFNNSWSMWMEK
ncbi:hypothetical protein PPYR_02934 [Photinus pyralis]|uniref:Sulfatase N-terminal domain-containing protein n=1 Tax=Photinus pyralis TaxID=7054 RepID=A0A1Y1LKW9_PHOPY|nr:arylsulfatase I-like [Photinus pyralis]KAB0791134.1 hypothetical protein PPYR_02934 [Photinus pyralis]